MDCCQSGAGLHKAGLASTPLNSILDTFRSISASRGGDARGKSVLAYEAATIRECRRALADRGRPLWREAVGSAPIEPWRNYPDGEVYDPRTHAQYFYHCHADAAGRQIAENDEHGHFHLFMRAEGMPPGVAPLLLPELAVADVPLPPQAAPLKRGGRDEISHLVAIALDVAGEPVRLFTTNCWVTGETWYGASDVIAMLDRFTIGNDRLLDRCIAAILRLFRDEIAELLRERDAVVMAWRRRRRSNVFEDPRLEIASSIAIDLDARLAEVERSAVDPMPYPEPRLVRRLPPMAEGWGA